MPAAIAALLLQLGCAPAEFNGPAGAFLVWVCPPVIAPDAPGNDTPEPARPAPGERAA